MAVSTAYVNQILPKDALAVSIPGHVIQVQHQILGSSLTQSNATTDLITISLTAKGNNSKFLLRGALSFSTDQSTSNTDQTEYRVSFNRNGANVGGHNLWGTNIWFSADVLSSYGTGYDTRQANGEHLDSPNVAAGTTITYTLRCQNGNATAYINRGSNNANTGSHLTFLTVMEIAQ